MIMEGQDDNITLQREELEVLSSIYGDDLCIEEEDPMLSFSVLIKLPAEKEASLRLSFDRDYPLNGPPQYQLSIPWIRGEKKKHISYILQELYLDNIGESIVFIWVERLRELLLCSLEEEEESESEEKKKTRDSINPDELNRVGLCKNTSATATKDNASSSEGGDANADIPTWTDDIVTSTTTGEPFTDRKSTFQAHVAPVTNVNQVRAVLAELYGNKKIASATHNMYAYRIHNNLKEKESRQHQHHDEKDISTSSTSAAGFIQDCDDDGETHAGSRLLHLLQILDCRNVLVVVTRWYGGIQLHGDRFKHINNVARTLLQQQGFIPAKDKK